MEYSINEEAFNGRDFKVVTGGIFMGPKLWIDGAEVKKEKNVYTLKDNSGNIVPVILKQRLYDPVPMLILGDKKVYFVPPLKWFEYTWIAWPFVILLAMGGALPAIFAIIGFFVNSKIFRSKLNGFLRYFLTLLSAALIWFVCVFVVGIVMGLIKK